MIDNNCNGGGCVSIELVDVSTQTESNKYKFKDRLHCGKRRRKTFLKMLFVVFIILFILLIFYTTMITN
jgi:hypothetical protein